MLARCRLTVPSERPRYSAILRLLIPRAASGPYMQKEGPADGRMPTPRFPPLAWAPATGGAANFTDLFRNRKGPEAQFPGILLIGSSVNRGNALPRE